MMWLRAAIVAAATAAVAAEVVLCSNKSSGCGAVSSGGLAAAIGA